MPGEPDPHSPESPLTKVGRSTSSPSCSAEVAWGAWGAWGLCSKSCGLGRRLRRRTCQSSSGDTCPGSPQEAQKCVRSRCPGRRDGARGWDNQSGAHIRRGPEH